jgi:hypothetical protein
MVGLLEMVAQKRYVHARIEERVGYVDVDVDGHVADVVHMKDTLVLDLDRGADHCERLPWVELADRSKLEAQEPVEAGIAHLVVYGAPPVVGFGGHAYQIHEKLHMTVGWYQMAKRIDISQQ